MAVSAKWYGTPIKNWMTGSAAVDFDSDTIKVALATSEYTPNQDTDEFFSNVTHELASEHGYTAGGVTLSSKAVTYDAASNESRFDAEDVSWTASGGSLTARYAIIYKSTGTSTTSPLLGWVDFGENNTVGSGAKFVIEWASTGILKIKAE